jgi:hypothetical protein
MLLEEPGQPEAVVAGLVAQRHRWRLTRHLVSLGSWFSPGSAPRGGSPHDGVEDRMPPNVSCEVHARLRLASTFGTRSSGLRPGGTWFRSGGTDSGVSMWSCRQRR